MVKLCDPSIVRDQCGLIIPAIDENTLYPPGTYEVYEGTYVKIRTATKCASYGAKTSVFVNGREYQSWQNYADVNEVVTHEMAYIVDEDTTFSIATYSFEGGSTFRKTDEYGPWVLKVKERPKYPYINRAKSGVIIDGELKPPGSYTVNPGTTITAQVTTHSDYPGMVRTAILINGEIVKYWDESFFGDYPYKYPIVVDRDMEITMAVYYYDESEGVYKKSDEYGCGGD